MSYLPNFPEITQRDGNVNALNDCVPACIADVIEYLTQHDVSAGQIKNEVYGDAYTGNTDPHQFVDEALKYGVLLSFQGGDNLAAIIHDQVSRGNPVIVNITDEYSTDPNETHAVVCHGEDSTAETIQYADPFIGQSKYQSDQWMNENIKYGYVCVASKVPVEQEQTMTLPQGWHDDGTTLSGPNGIAIVQGFRQWTLDHNETLGEALAVEYGASPIEPAHTQYTGTRQDFDFGSLGWTQDRGVYQINLHDEVEFYKSQVQQPVPTPAPVSPTPSPIPLNAEQQLALAAADLQKAQSEVQTAESDLQDQSSS